MEVQNSPQATVAATEQREARLRLPLRLVAPPAPQRGEEEGSSNEFSVTFIQSGYVRRRDGQQAAWRIPPETLRAAVGLLDSRAVFIDHAGWFDYPSLRNLAGVTFEPAWNEATQSIEGKLRLHETEPGQVAGELLGQILADQMAGREVPDVGLSLVFYGRHDWIDVGQEPGEEYERVTVEITYVESCDLVFGPGAEGRIKAALRAVGDSAASVAAPGLPQNQDSEQTPAGAGHRDAWPTAGAQITPNGGVSMPDEVQEQQLNSVEEPPATPPAAPASAPAAAQQPAAPPNGNDQANGNGHQAGERLDRIEQQLIRLTAALAREEDDHVVEGLGQAPRGGAYVHGMQTGMERFAPTIDWLFGVPDAPTPDPQYRRADTIYMAMTGDWEWRGVYRPDRVMLAGANTTDLPNLAVNAMNKVIVLQWASLRAYRWYELVSAVVPNDGSTHDMTWIGTGGVEVLPTVAEKGAYTELSMADTKEADSFTKYGGYVGITIEMFRKSQIAQIQAVPLGLARSAVMKRSALIAAIFTSNAGVGPTLDQDSKALFHADHSNVDTTAFGTTSTAWNAIDLAIWSQTELGSGKPLAISPKYMLCNRALFRAALVVFGYGDGQPTTYVPEAVDRGPDDPRPWPIAVPDFSDATDWAAIVDPRLYPVIMMSYAQATQGGQHPVPELYAVTSETQGLVFTNDTMPVKVRDWYAYGVNGYRGIAKRNVAG